MMYKIGDKVSVLDEDITGTIVRIEGAAVIIETDDGFELDFNKRELVLVNTSELSGDIFSKSSIVEIVHEKDRPKRNPQKKTKSKERLQPPMEVDLHIHQLTNQKGMSNYDMLSLQLETAQRQLDFAIKKRIQKVVFIHGVGAGVLKTELEYLFGRYNNVKYYDANYQKYGLGATEVYIYQNANP
ncbi:Smr/MutS family protein [Hanstruepera ponticola]|uniref:Smr/MutS family protein n=1 Tax=Hanstruepera ponticola TaxID=2042995 RepID=UPI00178393E5|nr:Smr/MutS family protein [Hanstruepera ponticola]